MGAALVSTWGPAESAEISPEASCAGICPTKEISLGSASNPVPSSVGKKRVAVDVRLTWEASSPRAGLRESNWFHRSARSASGRAVMLPRGRLAVMSMATAMPEIRMFTWLMPKGARVEAIAWHTA